MCFMAVFTALIEFAFINFLDMFIRRLKHRDLVRMQVPGSIPTPPLSSDSQRHDKEHDGATGAHQEAGQVL